jgi:putative membrane protein
MNTQKTESLALTLFKGLLIGVVATQVLDLIGTVMYDHEDKETYEAENAARDGKQAYEVGVAKIARAFGKTLTREEEQVWGWRFHKSFGIFGGIQYALLRKKNPQVGMGMGLAYGTGFFLIADEILIVLTGLVPGPQHFSWKVHARGAAAHIGWGVAAETTARVFDAIPSLVIKEDNYLLPQTAETRARANRMTNVHEMNSRRLRTWHDRATTALRDLP